MRWNRRIGSDRPLRPGPAAKESFDSDEALEGHSCSFSLLRGLEGNRLREPLLLVQNGLHRAL